MAGLGAAGLLLVNLPASAQLSGDISTSSGEVAATCSFVGLPDEYQLSYYGSDNYLRGDASFELATNVASPELEITVLTVNSELAGCPPQAPAVRMSTGMSTSVFSG